MALRPDVRLRFMPSQGKRNLVAEYAGWLSWPPLFMCCPINV